MNKKLLFAGISVIALGGAHTAFWVSQSSKIQASMEQVVAQIAKEVGKSNSEFTYTAANVSGYPFNFTVTIEQPKFVSVSEGERLELSADQEKLVVTSNLFGSKYKVALPSNLDAKQTVNAQETNYKLQFAGGAPQLELKFSNNVLSSGGSSNAIMSHLNDSLKSFKYSDAGYLLSNSTDGTKIASADLNNVQIIKKKSKPNNISTAYNITIKNADHSALFAQSNKKSEQDSSGDALWPINAKLSIISNDVRDEAGKSSSVDFTVNEADIAAASFGFVMKGDIKANGEDIFPFGNLSVKVNNYQSMVDYFSGTISTALAESKVPLFNIKSEKSIDFKKVLYEVASEKSNEEQDLLLTLSREKGKSLFIGQKGLMEVIDLLKASAAGTLGEEQKQDNVLNPGNKLIEAAPAAGMPAELSKE